MTDQSQQLALPPAPGQAESIDRLASLGRLLAAFLGDLDVADLTRAAYRRNLGAFIRWANSQPAGAPLGRGSVLAYKQWLLDEGYRATTISNYLSAVRRLFSWAAERGLAPNIAEGVSGARQSRLHRRDALTRDQALALLNSLPTVTTTDARNYALINLMVRTGLRGIECVRANVDNIRTRGSETLLWVHGKARDDADEFVVLTPESLDPIMRYLTMRGSLNGDEPLFANANGSAARLSTRTIRRIVKEALRSINLNSPRLTAHSLRHSCLSIAIEAGATLIEARDLARHRNAKTTELYIATSTHRLANAAEKKVAAILREDTNADEHRGSSPTHTPQTEGAPEDAETV